MKTVIRKADKEESFQEAARILQQGGLVAFPTETVYGLGGNALDKEAAKKIYAAKGRPSDNPLIVHIAKKEALADLTEYVPERAWTLAEHFWPGPLTMILPKSEKVPYGTTGGLDTVAVSNAKSSRCPSSDSGIGNLYCSTKCKYFRQTKCNHGRACD